MARAKIPNPLQRRHDLAGNMPAPRARAIAEAYCAEERWVEAVAFFAKAKCRDELQKLCARAVQQGDVFLLREASAALGETVAADAWRRCAEAAAKLGKTAYAEEAARQAQGGA